MAWQTLNQPLVPPPVIGANFTTRAGLEARDAHVFTELPTDMAATNLIHRFEAKLDALNAKLDAQNAWLAAQATTVKFLLWFIGVGVAVLIAMGIIQPG